MKQLEIICHDIAAQLDDLYEDTGRVPVWVTGLSADIICWPDMFILLQKNLIEEVSSLPRWLTCIERDIWNPILNKLETVRFNQLISGVDANHACRMAKICLDGVGIPYDRVTPCLDSV